MKCFVAVGFGHGEAKRRIPECTDVECWDEDGDPVLPGNIDDGFLALLDDSFVVARGCGIKVDVAGPAMMEVVGDAPLLVGHQ